MSLLLLQIGFIAPSLSTRVADSQSPHFQPVCLGCPQQRSVFCYTFRRLSTPSLSLVSLSCEVQTFLCHIHDSDCLLSQKFKARI